MARPPRSGGCWTAAAAPRRRLPAPRVDGAPLDPENEWGHDALWWLDRMVRTDRPLVEKMTLFWHGHFATRDQDTPLMLRQNRLLRRHALGSFRRLAREVTRDPAMLLFLSLADSDKEKPNENYARELMELFCLGSGYTEDDIREAARALTGFVSDYPESGLPRTYYDKEAPRRRRQADLRQARPLRLEGRGRADDRRTPGTRRSWSGSCGTGSPGFRSTAAPAPASCAPTGARATA